MMGEEYCQWKQLHRDAEYRYWPPKDPELKENMQDWKNKRHDA